MTDTVASTDGGNGAPAAPVQNESWFGGFDQETTGWLENRGLTKLDEKAALPELVKGFRNAEKFVGAPADKLIRIPDWDKADKVELDQIYNKLGRPNDPKEYNIPVPEGSPTDMAEWARSVFHEAGLSQRQAQLVASKWNELGASLSEHDVQAKQQAWKDQEAKLRMEWGNAYDKYDSVAARTIDSLGLQEPQLAALRDSLGFDGAMKMLASIGEKLGESDFVSGEGGSTSGPMTPAQAVSRISQLQGDREWVAKYIAGNAEARNEMERLMKMAYPG